MITFKQFVKEESEYLTEFKIRDAKSNLERAGDVKEKVDRKSIEIEIDATYPLEMGDGTIIQAPAGKTYIRARKTSSESPMEVLTITVADELRGSATLALSLIKRVRELAGEPIMLSDVLSPHGKRLVKAITKMGWTEERDGRVWVK